MTHEPENEVMVPQRATSSIKQDNFFEELKGLNVADGLHYLAFLKKIISSIPDVNQEKVDYLRSQIACGHYKINSEQIALGLIS